MLHVWKCSLYARAKDKSRTNCGDCAKKGRPGGCCVVRLRHNLVVARSVLLGRSISMPLVLALAKQWHMSYIATPHGSSWLPLAHPDRTPERDSLTCRKEVEILPRPERPCAGRITTSSRHTFIILIAQEPNRQCTNLKLQMSPLWPSPEYSSLKGCQSCGKKQESKPGVSVHHSSKFVLGGRCQFSFR